MARSRFVLITQINVQASPQDKVTSAAAIRKENDMTRLPQVRQMPRCRNAQLRLRLTFDLDVDICIVGAGLAGLTVALEAARLGASIAVLEGRHVGWNASGHHLGTVMPGFGVPVGELIERIGMEDAANSGRCRRKAPITSAPPRRQCRALRSPKAHLRSPTSTPATR